jgi:multicomponent Na+:H+ antiporter subunit E
LATIRGGFSASRALASFVVWLAVAGWEPKDVVVGAAVAIAAGAVSCALCPGLQYRIRPAAFAALTLSFLKGSIVAGLDVARRAMASEPRLNPGFVSFPLAIPAGFARGGFAALSSLQPGTLPTGIEGDRMIVHALDRSEPVAATLAADERRFLQAFGHE